MSEPNAAFVKLEIERADLIRWLDAPTPRASRWKDWREIGGSYYFKNGVQDIADVPSAELMESVLQCDLWLADARTNREMMRMVVGYAEAPELGIAAMSSDGATFVGGTLTYSENLTDYIFFLAFARGAADFLRDGRYGLAIIHNYIWGTADSTEAALRLSAGQSAFMTPDQRDSAGGACQAIADHMLDQEPDPNYAPRDQLDALR